MKLKNFSDYEIDVEEGKVWSYKRNRFVGTQHPNGYWYVSLMSDDGKPHIFLLHRVIWMSANGEIPEGLEVNHLDEDKSNNSISNLNLLTRKENNNYGTRTQRTSRQVAAYKNGVLVMVFPSTAEAERNGYDHSAVAKCCNGKLPHYKGYQWRFLS